MKKPNDRQHDQQADEIVDTCIRIWRRLPELRRQAAEMGRGYPSGGGGIGGGDCGDECECHSPVERLTLHPKSDVAQEAHLAVLAIENMLKTARALDGLSARLMPATLDTTARANEVPLCELCSEPAPDKVHRIDGQPYHVACYHKVYRAGRAS